MANIVTVSVLAALRPGAPSGAVTRRGLLRLLTRRAGRSYCVVPWSHSDPTLGLVEAQYGAKWSPHGVGEVWGRYGPYLEALWVRYHDEGGDHDRVGRVGAGGWEGTALCRYGFDRVRVGWPAATHLGAGWRRVGPDAWEADWAGETLAATNGVGLFSGAPRLDGRTTPVEPAERAGLEFDSDDFPPALVEWGRAAERGAAWVELAWRGRLVRAYRREEPGWLRWSLDSWDNCRDPAFVAWNAQRGAEHEALRRARRGRLHSDSGA